MSKRYFKVTLSGYGGEFTMGRVSEEFVNYWEDVGCADSLATHLQQINWDEEITDTDSPPMSDNGENMPWFEVDDIEHINCVTVDGEFVWVEVDEDGNEIGDEEQGEIGDTMLCGHELYTSGEGGDVPVLMFNTIEKGTFGDITIETDGADFDPTLFKTIYAETDLGEFVTAVYYDGVEQEIDMDWVSTDSKGAQAMVGWANMDYIEPSPDAEAIREAIEELLEDDDYDYA